LLSRLISPFLTFLLSFKRTEDRDEAMLDVEVEVAEEARETREGLKE
jgi:hypothetical protein